MLSQDKEMYLPRLSGGEPILSNGENGVFFFLIEKCSMPRQIRIQATCLNIWKKIPGTKIEL